MVGVTGRQGIRLLFTLVLARILGPESFGIVAQAMVVIALTALFLEQGLAAALIQKRELSDEDVGSVFWVNVVSAVCFGALALAVAPLVASFFHSDELTPIVRVLAISIVALALAVVPRALLSRGLRFREIALAEVAAACVGGAAGILALLLEAGYWALVVQTIVTDVCVLVGLALAAGRLPLKWSFEALRGLWGFSARVFAFHVTSALNRNIDNVLIGRYLGATQLGYYALSYRTMMLPIQNLGVVANRVTLPLYSRLQDQPDRLRRQYLAGARLIALIAFPGMGLVIVGAPLGVPLVFGDAWAPAAVPMQILAVAGMRQSVLATTGGVLAGCGKPEWLLRYGLVTSLVTIASIVVGLQWGIVGVAVAYTLGTVLLAPWSVHLVGRLLSFGIRQFAEELLPVTIATVMLIIIGSLVQAGVAASGAPEPVTLMLGLFASTIAYVLVLRLRWPDELTKGRAFLGLMLKPAAKPASVAV